jgi:diacylglycerol kinase family enzyme
VTRRALVVINPGAGRHPHADAVRSLLPVLEGGDIAVEIAQSAPDASDLSAIARRAVTERFDAVIAVGGDHTVQLIAREIIDTDVVLGILPFGSFMNITKGLRIPLDPAGAASVIARGHVRRADVGEVNSQVFFESAGIGLDAEVFGAARAAERGRWRGAWRRAVRWATQETHSIRIEGRSRVAYRALQVIVLNSPFYTWSFPMVGGDMHDGLLEIAVFPRMGRLALLGSLLRLATSGRHETAPIVLREASARISADMPLPIQADTRMAGTLPATFRCRAGAFAVYVPEVTAP